MDGIRPSGPWRRDRRRHVRTHRTRTGSRRMQNSKSVLRTQFFVCNVAHKNCYSSGGGEGRVRRLHVGTRHNGVFHNFLNQCCELIQFGTKNRISSFSTFSYWAWDLDRLSGLHMSVSEVRTQSECTQVNATSPAAAEGELSVGELVMDYF